MRRLRPAFVIVVVLFLLFSASAGAIWAIGAMGAPPEATAPATLVVAEETRGREEAPEVVEISREISENESRVNIALPTEIVLDYTYLPWNLTLVNRYNVLPADFEVYLSDIGGGHYFDARAADSLVAMLASARSEGLSPLVVSTYRSIARQTTLFNNQLNRRLEQGMSHDDAFDAARRVVAYPGESEHNLGLAADIVANHYRNLTAGFGQTDEGIWLAQNSHRYGFVLRYPYHKQDITNIIYEPWHFRYVGVPHATTMFQLDLVLEEYIELLKLNY